MVDSITMAIINPYKDRTATSSTPNNTYIDINIPTNNFKPDQPPFPETINCKICGKQLRNLATERFEHEQKCSYAEISRWLIA